jgi:spermidine synthase
LRIDGTQASVHRDGRFRTGTVWWALGSPVLLIPPRRARRVLLLGLAAGSVARAVRVLAPEAEIVGVEIDRRTVELGRRHFGLGHLGVEVVVADALRYLRDEKRYFDLVVEDLFLGPSRCVHKPPWLVEEGYDLIRQRLRPGGYVVSNTIHETPEIVTAMRRLGGSLLSIDVRGYWNRVVVCGRDLPPPRAFRVLLSRCSETAAMLRRVSLRSL